MATAGSERTGMLEHPLADKFRGVIERFGGTREIANKLLARFRYLKEDYDGILIGDIYREADLENGIAHSWVELEFNPHTKGLISLISLTGTIRRELSRDVLNDVKQIHMPDEGTVIFGNGRGRKLWLDGNNLLVTTPS